jgi:two-component system response regulator YesN
MADFFQKAWKRVRFDGLYFKILLYFLFLLIPTALIGLVTYFYYAGVLRNDFTNKIKINLASSARNIAIYLELAQKNSINFFKDDTVRGVLAPQSGLTAEQCYQLQKIPEIIIRNQNVVSEFVSNVFVYLDAVKVYTGAGMDDFDLFFGKFYRFRRYRMEFWRNLLKSDRNYLILPPSRVESNYQFRAETVIPFVTIDDIKGNSSVMVVSISAAKIYWALKKNSIFPSSQFLVIDGNGNLILTPDSPCLDPETPARLNRIFAERREGSAELTINRRRVIVTYYRSDNFGWRYYSFTPKREFSRNATVILRMALLLCLVLLAVGIFFSFIFSTRIYNPIKNIRDILTERSEDTPENQVSSSSLKSIEKMVNNLADHETLYRNKVKSLFNEYLENMLTAMLNGYYIGEDNELSAILAREKRFQGQYYLCCNVWFNFSAAFYALQDIDRIKIFAGLTQIISTLIARYLPCYTLQYKQNLYVSLINLKTESDLPCLRKALDDLTTTFEYDTNYCEICVGIGKLHTGLNSLSRTFNEAMSAIEKRSAGPRVQIIDAQSCLITNTYYYSFSDQNKLLDYLKSGEIGMVEGLIKEIFRINKERGVSHAYLDRLYAELINTGIRSLVEQGLEARQFLTADALDRCHDLDCNFQGRQKQLLQFYETIIQAIQKKVSGAGPLIAQAIKYIEENFTQDIYLEKIAANLGVSVKYLSRAFKQNSGWNITDYISMVRITKAKELLIASDMNVNEIAERVGIYSRTTFLRLFKKSEGVSPGRFRELMRPHD